MKKTFNTSEQAQNTYKSFKTDELKEDVQSVQPNSHENKISINSNTTLPTETTNIPKSGPLWTFPLLQQKLESITHHPRESQV